MDTAEKLAESIPDLAVSLDRQAVIIWLRRQGLTLDELRVRGRESRRPNLVEGRRLVAEFLKARGWSYAMIGAELGYADHSTIVYLLNSRRSA